MSAIRFPSPNSALPSGISYPDLSIPSWDDRRPSEAQQSSRWSMSSSGSGSLQYSPPLRGKSTVRTRPMPLGATGVFFEREPTVPSDNDILLVTVKISFKSRSNSTESNDQLPSRPPRRSFLKRMSTRWSSQSIDFKQYKTLRMPRREYQKYFAKDKNMKYIGTEPEREWGEEELMQRYAEYQHLPLFAAAT